MSNHTRRYLSSYGWQLRRKFVLERDHYQCQVLMPNGMICGARASVAGHIIPDAQGGSHDPENLRAECAEHSSKLNNPKAWAQDMGHPANKPSRRW